MSIDQSLIRAGQESLEEMVLVVRKVLGKNEQNHLLFGIDLAKGGCRAGPTECAKGARSRVLSQIDQYGNTQAEAEVPGAYITAMEMAQMVCGHELHCLASENPPTVQGAAVEEHLREAGVVAAERGLTTLSS